jgi:signal transduction histidine kinase
MHPPANQGRANPRGGPGRSRSSASRAANARGLAEVLQDAVGRAEYAFLVCDVQPATRGKLPTLHILFANQALKAITGLEPSEAVAKDLVSLLAPKRGAPLHGRLNDLVQAGKPATVGAIRRKVGRATRDFELAAVPLGRSDDRPTRWAFVLREVTAQQQRNRRRGRRVDELEGIIASQAAELKTSHEAQQRGERMATLGTLVSGLGHDLNNLLLPIRGHLKALESSPLDDSARMHIHAVGQSVDYLQQLNENLRLFALDPDGPSDARGVTDIREWWDRLQAMLERAIPASMQLHVDLPDGLPVVGVAAHRLTQAVLNLLINASEAVTDSGTIRLWADISNDGQYVRMGVTDNGRGMTNEVRRRAFDPFFTTKRRSRATGLGLSLVHGIVRSAGGTVEVDSAPGRGTTIVLNLPTVPSDRVAQEMAKRDNRHFAAVSVRDRRIAACFRALLASAGFTVRPAPAGGTDPVALWVTEPRPSALTRARELRAANPHCRIVLFGRGSDEWRSLGALAVEREGGLGTLREALIHAISAKT